MKVTQAWTLGIDYGPTFASQKEAEDFLAFAQEWQAEDEIASEWAIEEWSPALFSRALADMHGPPEPQEPAMATDPGILQSQLAAAEAEIERLKNA